MRKGFDSYLSRAKAPVQTRIDTIWLEKKEADARISLVQVVPCYSMPVRKANCPYFVGGIKLTQRHGEGAPIPKGAIVDGPCLKSMCSSSRKIGIPMASQSCAMLGQAPLI